MVTRTGISNQDRSLWGWGGKGDGGSVSAHLPQGSSLANALRHLCGELRGLKLVHNGGQWTVILAELLLRQPS